MTLMSSFLSFVLVGQFVGNEVIWSWFFNPHGVPPPALMYAFRSAPSQDLRFCDRHCLSAPVIAYYFFFLLSLLM